jgi:hypothetical protein
MTPKASKLATKTPAPTAKPTAKAPVKPAATPAVKAPAEVPLAVKASTPSTGLAKLRVGDVYEDKGQKVVVWFLNESRACIAALDSSIEVRYRDDGTPGFAASKSLGNISPDSEVEVTESLGRKGLAALIEKRKTEEPAPKAKATKAKAAKPIGTPGIRAGSLGNYLGFSIASVIRTLAKAGWKFAELRAWLDSIKIESSDQTIKLNIYRANHPERPDSGEHAPLSKDQVPVKPVIEGKKEKQQKVQAIAAKIAAKPTKATPAPAPIVPAKPRPGDKAAAQIARLKAEAAAKTAQAAA